MKARSLLVVAGAILAMLIHAGLVLRAYPPGFLMRGDVPLMGDVPRYFATTVAVAETGGLYGYDPYNMAGYPAGLWNSMGKKGFEIAHLLLPWIGLPRLFYLVIVGLCLLCPVALWLALRPYAGAPIARRLLFGLSLVFWHLSTDIAYFWSFGNIFFPAAACALGVMVVLADQVLSGRRPLVTAAALGVMASAVFYAHTVALVAALAPLAALLVLRRAWRLPVARWGGLLVALLTFAALSVWWLVPLLQTRGDCLPQPKDWFQSGPKQLVMDLFSDRAYRQPFDRNFLYHVVVVLGLCGTWMLWRQRQRPLFVALGVGGAAALALTYGGSYVDALQPLQPYRFTIPASLLLLGPAAAALEAGWGVVRHSTPAMQRVVAVLLLLLMPGFTGYLIDLTWPRSSMAIPAAQLEVMQHLRDHPVQGRVLIDEPSLGHILPYFNRVSVLGGLSTQAFLKHRFAGIDEEGIGFGRKAEEWTAETLRPYLDAYGFLHPAPGRRLPGAGRCSRWNARLVGMGFIASSAAIPISCWRVSQRFVRTMPGSRCRR